MVNVFFQNVVRDILKTKTKSIIHINLSAVSGIIYSFLLAFFIINFFYTHHKNIFRLEIKLFIHRLEVKKN